jgi:very-short-patch-repair endonuclease
MPRKRHHTHRTSDKGTIAFAKELRRNKTTAEKLLWKHLRRKELEGFRFRQQHPIGPYIVDFYCDEAGLVVELDGGIHLDAEQRQKDWVRDRSMNDHGLTVLRFENREIIDDIDRVLGAIRRVLLERTRG